jgi:hypothetical protein
MEQRTNRSRVLKVQRVSGRLMRVTLADGQSFYMKDGKIGMGLKRIENESKRPE